MTSPIIAGVVKTAEGKNAPMAGGTVSVYDTGASPPLQGTATSDADGRFSISVPSTDAQGIWYATASFPGNVLLVTVIGPSVGDPITINQLTTVAAAYAFAQFVESSTISGSAFALRIAAGMSANLASPLSGQPSEVMLNPPNADQTNSLRSLRSLGNLLAVTVRPGAWDTLVGLSTPPGGPAPGDTFQAMVNIARHPSLHVGAIFRQSQGLDYYAPPLAVPPDAWTLCVKVNDTGDREPGYPRMFGGPANISWDRNGFAWIANNVFQGGPFSCDFVVVLQPNGKPSDGTNGTPVSPVIGGGMVGPGFGVSIDRNGDAWVGSFGWGPSDTFPTAGIASKFDASGNDIAGGGYLQGTQRIQGVASDPWNNIWLASFGDSRITVFPEGSPVDPGGNPTWFTYPPEGSSTQAPGVNTFGIAIDTAATVPTAWVTYSGGLGWPDANEGHVARYTIDGSSLSLDFHRPIGKVTKGIALDSKGNVWIASGGDDSVYMVTPEGEARRFTDGGGLSGPWGVAVDGNDDVWVANFGRMGVTRDYTNAGMTKLAGVDSPSGMPVGEPLCPETGFTLPTAGEPVTLFDGSPLYRDGTLCYSPLMRMTSVTIDAAGNIWAVNNWKPRFGSDFEPCSGNPGGDGIVIFVGMAKPPVMPDER